MAKVDDDLMPATLGIALGIGAIAKIAPGRGRPDRHAELIADAHDVLHLLGAGRLQDRRHGVFLIGDRHHGLEIGGQPVLVGQHVVCADDGLEFGDRGQEILFRDPVRDMCQLARGHSAGSL
jgi:hypothetical protein